MENRIKAEQTPPGLVVKPDFVAWHGVVVTWYVESAAIAVTPIERRPRCGPRSNDPVIHDLSLEIGRLLSAHIDPGPYLADPFLERGQQYAPLAVEVVVPFNPGIGPFPDHLLAEHAHDQQPGQEGQGQGGPGQGRLRCE